MFFTFSKLLVFLSKPYTWIFILLICALKFKYIRKKILGSTIILFFIFSNSFLANTFTILWQDDIASINKINKTYDFGVVLGGFSSYDERTNRINFNASGDRLITAIELYHLGIIKNILISGGNGELINNSKKESIWSYNFLINMNVNKNDILLESNSRNTMENIINTTELIATHQKVLLITSANHMKRAKFCCNKTKLKCDYLSTDHTFYNKNIPFKDLFIPNIYAMKKWEDLIHEWIGFLVYKVIY